MVGIQALPRTTNDAAASLHDRLSTLAPNAGNDRIDQCVRTLTDSRHRLAATPEPNRTAVVTGMLREALNLPPQRGNVQDPAIEKIARAVGEQLASQSKAEREQAQQRPEARRAASEAFLRESRSTVAELAGGIGSSRAERNEVGVRKAEARVADYLTALRSDPRSVAMPQGLETFIDQLKLEAKEVATASERQRSTELLLLARTNSDREEFKEAQTALKTGVAEVVRRDLSPAELQTEIETLHVAALKRHGELFKRCPELKTAFERRIPNVVEEVGIVHEDAKRLASKLRKSIAEPGGSTAVLQVLEEVRKSPTEVRRHLGKIDADNGGTFEKGVRQRLGEPGREGFAGLTSGEVSSYDAFVLRRLASGLESGEVPARSQALRELQGTLATRTSQDVLHAVQKVREIVGVRSDTTIDAFANHYFGAEGGAHLNHSMWRGLTADARAASSGIKANDRQLYNQVVADLTAGEVDVLPGLMALGPERLRQINSVAIALDGRPIDGYFSLGQDRALVQSMLRGNPPEAQRDLALWSMRVLPADGQLVKSTRGPVDAILLNRVLEQVPALERRNFVASLRSALPEGQQLDAAVSKNAGALGAKIVRGILDTGPMNERRLTELVMDASFDVAETEQASFRTKIVDRAERTHGAHLDTARRNLSERTSVGVDEMLMLAAIPSARKGLKENFDRNLEVASAWGDVAFETARALSESKKQLAEARDLERQARARASSPERGEEVNADVRDLRRRSTERLNASMSTLMQVERTVDPKWMSAQIGAANAALEKGARAADETYHALEQARTTLIVVGASIATAGSGSIVLGTGFGVATSATSNHLQAEVEIRSGLKSKDQAYAEATKRTMEHSKEAFYAALSTAVGMKVFKGIIPDPKKAREFELLVAGMRSGGAAGVTNFAAHCSEDFVRANAEWHRKTSKDSSFQKLNDDQKAKAYTAFMHERGLNPQELLAKALISYAGGAAIGTVGARGQQLRAAGYTKGSVAFEVGGITLLATSTGVATRSVETLRTGKQITMPTGDELLHDLAASLPSVMAGRARPGSVPSSAGEMIVSVGGFESAVHPHPKGKIIFADSPEFVRVVAAQREARDAARAHGPGTDINDTYAAARRQPTTGLIYDAKNDLILMKTPRVGMSVEDQGAVALATAYQSARTDKQLAPAAAWKSAVESVETQGWNVSLTGSSPRVTKGGTPSSISQSDIAAFLLQNGQPSVHVDRGVPTTSISTLPQTPEILRLDGKEIFGLTRQVATPSGMQAEYVEGQALLRAKYARAQEQTCEAAAKRPLTPEEKGSIRQDAEQVVAFYDESRGVMVLPQLHVEKGSPASDLHRTIADFSGKVAHEVVHAKGGTEIEAYKLQQVQLAKNGLDLQFTNGQMIVRRIPTGQPVRPASESDIKGYLDRQRLYREALPGGPKAVKGSYDTNVVACADELAAMTFTLSADRVADPKTSHEQRQKMRVLWERAVREDPARFNDQYALFGNLSSSFLREASPISVAGWTRRRDNRDHRSEWEAQDKGDPTSKYRHWKIKRDLGSAEIGDARYKISEQVRFHTNDKPDKIQRPPCFVVEIEFFNTRTQSSATFVKLEATPEVTALMKKLQGQGLEDIVFRDDGSIWAGVRTQDAVRSFHSKLSQEERKVFENAYHRHWIPTNKEGAIIDSSNRVIYPAVTPPATVPATPGRPAIGAGS